ncbi:MAG: Hpt domain-containing protein [Gammaproteobacteria bacterium]|nr:Hpt domain-containing protein [Gammaproteobacteria bacterium]
METTAPLAHVSADLADLVPRYLQNRRTDLNFARQLLRDGDFYLLAGLAHRIQGSASSYGFATIGDIAREVEKAAEQRDGMAIESHLRALERFLDSVEVTYV